MLMDLPSLARALDGCVCGHRVLAPGPGHSPADRSLSVWLDPCAPDGFRVHSFAGDHFTVCRDHVRRMLGLRRRGRPEVREGVMRIPERNLLGDTRHNAQTIWREAVDPCGTPVEAYLKNRCHSFPRELAGEVIRYHRTMQLGGRPVGGMVVLIRDLTSDEPCGVQRTFLDRDGRKIKRLSLGRMGYGAAKLDPDAAVSTGLVIGEGVETCISAYLGGFRPVWSVISAGGIATFPLLPGIEGVTILGENDANNANWIAASSCERRWRSAGRDFMFVDTLGVGDFNDVWMGIAA